MISGRQAAEDAPVMVVLRGLGLGGLLAAVPALRALRRAHPGHRIVLAASASLADLVPLIGAVDELLDVPGPGPLRLGSPPDLAVNLYGRGPWSIGALRRTDPGLLLTHAHPGFPDVRGPSWRGDAHVVRRWCELLGWHGIAADPVDLGLKAPPAWGVAPTAALRGTAGPDLSSERSAPVVVHPGAAAPARRWPPERFALLAVALRQAGHEVVITGSAGERALAERVASLACLPEASVLAGRTGLGELAALVARARLVVCGDTGVARLATAFATPSVVLFGPVSPALWGPSHGPHVALWAGRSGDPRGNLPDEGLLEIGVREVLGAVVDLLEVDVR
ncbi:ADP-heptose:LPS heptosyltransferase [Streptosporangium album]|uniref:ADP-heptose:LPS heptosyltransferase n=1 Tax=Streptosporangium album TaxID=47479 RepID=A0A7W7RZZ8_9ACTN|nr:glycosyltransferase family 9 protein [Streptosporangium album]MBB4941032.1 ADP-heptose:LPS heptosyltransferase [Streptosporangium album]